MTLSTPVTRAQQTSASGLNTAALQAATLSFGKKLPPFPREAPGASNSANNKALVSGWSSTPSSQTEGRTLGGGSPLLAVQKSFSKSKGQKSHPQSLTNIIKSPLNSRSPIIATNIAVERIKDSPKKNCSKVYIGDEEEILPARGTVDARQKLFRSSRALSLSPIASSQMQKTVPTNNTNSALETEAVDVTSIEDISLLKDLFEKNIPGLRVVASPTQSPPVLDTPKPTWFAASLDNPSLTAAVLATQLSPNNSARNSRHGSRLQKPISTSTHGSPTLISHGNFSSLDALPKLFLPPPSGVLELSRTGVSSVSSRESMPSKVSATSDCNNALLAATFASKPRSSSGPQSKSPKPPPPRRTRTRSADVQVNSSDRIQDQEVDSGTLSANSAATGHSKYDTIRSSMSFKLDKPPASAISLARFHSAVLPPRRPSEQAAQQSAGDKSSTALTVTSSSVAASQNVSSSLAHPIHNHQPPPQHLTGDSVRAASLAPSRVASPSPKKHPAPPVRHRGRRMSLPSSVKIGLRETMRQPPKTLPKEISPQRRRPRLVKHHPHKHSEGDRRRWRHFVTESERKRYEGLWVANKGLLFHCSIGIIIATPPLPLRKTLHNPHNFQQQHVWSSTPSYTELPADCVNSLVVRDVWSRSRLPSDHLADVWDLVDRGEKGHLSRDEFVVGTWLIDQSLKGRKLPSRVQDEVWQSVRRLGVKIQPTANK